MVGIGPATRQDETVYDPACGSGSLLLKAADEAPRGMSMYGQEKDNATWALARMNMILHSHEDADIRKGDAITSPQFLNGAALQTFDYAVMNPPFSVKSWTNGLEADYGRFELGRPPDKNGDYAFLLHVLKSLKPSGKAAVILPHGVLFRGQAEAGIRRQLLIRGYVKGVIGLPPNLFYGTGIPACIVVLDKEGTTERRPVFIVDASKGFMKDGAKNRLRKPGHSQDRRCLQQANRGRAIFPLGAVQRARGGIQRVQPEPFAVYRLADPEDIQDLNAHFHGGIPERDVNALQSYWDAFPSLRSQLFETSRLGYGRLSVKLADVEHVVAQSAEVQQLRSTARDLVHNWFGDHRAALSSIDPETGPADLISAMGEDLLARFREFPLLDEYDVYEQLLSYWHGTMHDERMSRASWNFATAVPV